MNEGTLVVVQAYAGDRHRVDGMLDGWLHHGCRVLIISPEDSRVEVDGVECRWAGKRGWAGPHTIERQIEHLKIIAEYKPKRVLYNDSDSFCLTPQIPTYLYAENTFFSREHSTIEMLENCEFLATKPHDLSRGNDTYERDVDVQAAVRALLARGPFDIKTYYARQPLVFIPPYFFSGRTLARMIKHADESRKPENLLVPFIDWWFPTVTKIAGIKHADITNDSRMVHPVKNKAELNRLLEINE